MVLVSKEINDLTSSQKGGSQNTLALCKIKQAHILINFVNICFISITFNV